MTPLDLKIKYRFDTGLSPTFGKDKTGHNYRGGYTQEYAEWLENWPYLVDASWQRRYFRQDTGHNAVTIGRDGNLYYTRAYKEYMEELLCKVLTGMGNGFNK